MTSKYMRAAAVALLLAIACALLFSGALEAGWAYDDPAHLNFVTTYSPWQYFTVRDVLRLQSYAHITPWNALFYEIGLALGAGVDPRWHHLHLVLVVWATAFATWVLLKRWLGESRALIGALLFLAMPATAGLAWALTIGHYAYGLLFAVSALLAFAHAIEKRSLLAGCLAAFLYAMACLSKELYVPLPLLLLLWPEGTLLDRLRVAAPSLLVAVGYAVLRWWVVGGLGGMQGESGSSSALLFQPATAWSLLGGLQSLSFGAGTLGAIATVLTAVAVLLPGRRPRQLSIVFVVASLGVLLFPIVALVRQGAEAEAHRFICFVAWALAVLVAWRLPGRRGGLAFAVVGCAIAVVLGTSLVVAQHVAVRALIAHTEVLKSEYDFMMQAEPDAVLMPKNFRRVGYLNSMARVVTVVTGRKTATVLQNDDELAALGTARGRLAWAWQDDCHCLRPLGERYDQQTQRFVQRLEAGRNQILGVRLSLEDHALTKTLRWQLTGVGGEAWADMASAGRFGVANPGDYTFGLDFTSEVENPMRIRFTAEAADGSLIRTPIFTLPLNESSKLEWPPAITVLEGR